MEETVSYLMVLMMCAASAMVILKMTRFSAKAVVLISAAWGAAGYLAIINASESTNLQNKMLLSPGMMLAAVFIECGIMSAWAFSNIESPGKRIATRLLALYPGLSIAFPIFYGATAIVCSFPGKSFQTLGLLLGAGVAVTIYSLVSMLQKLRLNPETTQETAYYCAFFVWILCVFIYGLLH